ncbi:NifB/NifX family molybdenum-iron cluster-binding protein [Cetobacterium somerae]
MKNLKIACPTNDGIMLDSQFYGCKNFKVFVIENNKLVDSYLLTPPKYEHGNMPEFLLTDKVNVIISGPIGEATLSFLNQHKVEMIYGLEGVLVDLIRLYLMHELKSVGEPYNHKNYKEYIK